MISDWSGISLEYAFVMEHPVIFIDVPKKEMNTESKYIKCEPIEISLRNKVGNVISPEDIENIPHIIENLSSTDSRFNLEIKNTCKNTVFNIGNSARVGAKYVQDLVSEL